MQNHTTVVYQELIKGDTPVIALRKAQSAIRANEKWQAPYYWAAWIIVGDGWEKPLSKT